MIVSWNWLTQYVRLEMPVDELTHKLAVSGLNHEGTEEVGGDLAIDLEVTSNRPDCLNHIGVAREIAVLFGKTLTMPDPKPPESGAPVEALTSVTVEDTALCPRFTARVITGAKIGPSPWWLQKRLETIGVRPISNVVDITNYVLFECGQPLHTYDLDTLIGKRLVVRRARNGEKLVAINGKTYTLTSDMLAICDADRPVGLGGVMGGLETEIGDKTENILIESARFDPISIRHTSRALGLSSPSSFRFERPMDPEITEWASRRCAELILELAGGTLHPGVIDTGAEAPKPQRHPVTLRIEQIERVLGIPIERETTARILQDLGLELLDSSEGALTFRPPSWRSDLDREIDLIEEVARVHGYNHIPEDQPVSLAASSLGRRERVEREVRNALTGLGFDEAVTFSLVADELLAPLDPGKVGAAIRTEHPGFKKQNALRQSLVPSLLSARSYNEAHGVADARLFEVANVYLAREGRALPDEQTHIGIVAGLEFLELKGVLEALLGRFQLAEQLRAQPVVLAPFAEGRSAELFLGTSHLGYLGEIDRSALDDDAIPLRNPCSAIEVDFGVIEAEANLVPQYQGLPSFPATTRDLSLVVERSLPWAELAEAVRKAGGPTLESIRFLDTFSGGNLPEGTHSLHFGMTFRHPEKTLTGEEADATVHAIVEACRARFGATLRA